jgi:hypothetical protein
MNEKPPLKPAVAAVRKPICRSRSPAAWPAAAVRNSETVCTAPSERLKGVGV